MFLFKGWMPAFIRLGPNTVLMFVFFEVQSLRHADLAYVEYSCPHSTGTQEDNASLARIELYFICDLFTRFRVMPLTRRYV